MSDEIQALRGMLKEALAERDQLRLDVERLQREQFERYTIDEVRAAVESRIAAWVAGEVIESLLLSKEKP